MRRLIVFSLVLALGWSTYWLVGKTAKQTAMTAWLEDRRAAGWVADYSDFRVVGFPNRFDSRFTALQLGSNQSRIFWKADWFQILALSYKPNHIIAAFSNQQQVTLNRENISVVSEKMLASVVFQPDTNLALQRLSLKTDVVDLTSDLGWNAGARDFSFATRQAASGLANGHDVALSATAIRPTEAIRRALNPKGDLPDRIELAAADMELGFDAPWDRIALESGAPLLKSLNLRRFDLVWGDLKFDLKGEITIDAAGRPTGDLDLRVTNWRRVLEILRNSGAVPHEISNTIETALGLLTHNTENPQDLDVPLSFTDGQMFLGPIPIGTAPRLLQR